MRQRTKTPVGRVTDNDRSSDRSSGSFHHPRPSRALAQWTARGMACMKLTAAGPLPIRTGFPFKRQGIRSAAKLAAGFKSCQCREEEKERYAVPPVFPAGAAFEAGERAGSPAPEFRISS